MYADGVIIGNLTGDPKPFEAGGREYASVSVGVNPAKDKSNFFRLIATGEQMEELMKYRKGDLIITFAEPQQRMVEVRGAQWTDPEKAKRPVRVSDVTHWIRQIYGGDFVEVRIRGVLQEAPTLNHTQSGQPVANFRLECDVRGRAIVKRVAVFGRQAEALVEYKNAGEPLFVTGYLTQNEYEKNGQTRVSETIIATRVTWLPVPRTESEMDGGSSAVDTLAALMGEELEADEDPMPEADDATTKPVGVEDAGVIESDEAIKQLFG